MSLGLLVNIVVPVTVVLLMTAVGLHLRLSAVREVVERPRSLALATLLQILLLPAAALALIAVFAPEPLIALVILAISVSPGGALSNVFTMLAGGNLALSVLMTTTTTLLVSAEAPLVLALARASGLLGAETVAMLDPVSVAVDLFLFALVPICAGLLCAQMLPHLLPALRRAADRLAMLAIAALLVCSVVVSWPVLAQASGGTLLLAGAFSLVSIGLGWTVSRLLVPEDRTACILEFGVRNLAIALFLATGPVPSLETVAFLLTYFLLNTGIIGAISVLRKTAFSRALA